MTKQSLKLKMNSGALIVDIEGTALESADHEVLLDPRVSGVIFFARNFADPEQIMDLVRSIRELRSDLILSVDQEGGRVQRFQTGMTRLPSFAALAAAGTDACRDLGWLMAREILELGIDLSYTPVLDINYGRNSVIADRSFGADAATVVRCASAYIDGMTQAGMSATGKHFPGHGWVELDSHIALPIDGRPLEQIESADYDVFVQMKDSLAAVMTAHVLYKTVDPCIATYSSTWMNKLRQEINFKGLIISDDLAMAGATGIGCVTTRAQAAIDAGCDLLLMCNNREAVLELLESDRQWYSKTSIEGLRGRVGHEFASLHQQEEYQSIREHWKALLN